MTKARLLLSAAFAAMSLAGSAQAAPTVVAFNLTSVFPTGAPVNPLMGQFSASFNNAADVSRTSSGLTVTGLNYTPSLPLLYSYSAANKLLIIGDFDISVGACNLRGANNDFCLYYDVQSSSAVYTGYSYSNGNYYFTTTSVTTPLTPSVPEPTTWAMMIAGFGVVGFSMRRRQKVTVSYAA